MDPGHPSPPSSPSSIDSSNLIQPPVPEADSESVGDIPLPPLDLSSRNPIAIVYRQLDYGPLCQICKRNHQPYEDCPSKPEYPPAFYYNKCFICSGFHAKNQCYSEYLRESLTTPSYCSNCDTTHIGFCKQHLYCKNCNSHHNFTDECVRQVSLDLSGKQCQQCGFFHTLHCPSELRKIESDLSLYCNRCGIKHKLLKCVPFCHKCFRRHQDSDTGRCPPENTYCAKCKYCHPNDTCPI